MAGFQLGAFYTTAGDHGYFSGTLPSGDASDDWCQNGGSSGKTIVVRFNDQWHSPPWDLDWCDFTAQVEADPQSFCADGGYWEAGNIWVPVDSAGGRSPQCPEDWKSAAEWYSSPTVPVTGYFWRIMDESDRDTNFGCCTGASQRG